MKFNKTLVAVAIAGIAAAPMVASADTTISGILQIQLQGSDVDDVNAIPDNPNTPEVETVEASSPGDLKVAAGDVRLNVLSEHELNSGLTGYGNYRIDWDGLSNQLDDDDETKFLSGDSVYVGIKGGFGDFRIGETAVAVEYGQVANDIYDVAGDMEQAVAYTGSFGPVSLGLNWSPENNQDRIGAGVKFGLGGFGIGLGFEQEDETDKLAAGVTFAAAGASVAAHFWSQDFGAEDNEESISVKVGYGFGGVAANLTFSTLELGSVDQTAIRLDLGYDLGGGTNISTRITSYSGDTVDRMPDPTVPVAEADLVEYRVQLTKTF